MPYLTSGSLQVHLPSGGKPAPRTLRQPHNVQSTIGGMSKPTGVFWTSTMDGASCPWLDWCRSEMPEWVPDEATIVEVIRYPKVYEINSPTDYYDLQARYPLKSPYPDHPTYNNLKLVDWAKVAREYNGVHLQRDVGRDGMYYRNRGCTELYGWDCESTAWFRTNCIRVHSVVAIRGQYLMPPNPAARRLIHMLEHM